MTLLQQYAEHGFEEFKENIDQALKSRINPIATVLDHLGMTTEQLRLYAISSQDLYNSLIFNEENLGDFCPINPATESERQKAVLLIKQIIEEREKQGDQYNPISFFTNYIDPLNDVDKRLIATLAQWLPSNYGRSFIQSALTLHRTNKIKLEDAYLYAWTLVNKRTYYLNNGTRVLESLYGDSAVEAYHYELAEHFICWLSTNEGRDYLLQIIPEYIIKELVK